MLLNKHFVRSVFLLACGSIFYCQSTAYAAPLEVVWPEGNTRMVDWETHGDSTDIEKGIYFDEGWDGNPGWRTGYWPYGSMNGNQRYLSSWQEGYIRSGIAFWMLKIPKTGFYRLETCYKQTENRTHDADYAVYTDTTIKQVEQNYPATSPPADSIGYKVVDQNSHTVDVPWADLGTYCLEKNSVSMIVLDGRDDNVSDSADASRWTYVGDEYNDQRCGTANMAPVNHLLLNRKN